MSPWIPTSASSRGSQRASPRRHVTTRPLGRAVLGAAAVITALALCALALTANAAPAQSRLTAQADRLLAAGRVAAAESLYYDAVRRAPYDPEARLALGRYLAARGAWKVGAVLMEEARYFGGDARRVAEALAPVYARLGDFKSLAALPSSPLDAAERQRADWLRDHPPAVTGFDSSTVRLRPAGVGSLGTVELRIGGERVLASIDPRVEGLVLDTAWRRRPEVRHWVSKSRPSERGVAAVTLSVGIGDLTLQHVPTRLASSEGTAIGLDVLSRLAPTFDASAGVLTLRRGGRVSRFAAGERFPALVLPTGTAFVRGGQVLPMHGSAAQRVLRTRRWTLDSRRGDIILGG